MLWIVKYFLKSKNKKLKVLSNMIANRDKTIYAIKKQNKILSEKLDQLNEINSKLIIENKYYSEETAKKDLLLDAR